MTEPQTRRVAVIGGGHIAPETARLLTDTPVREWPVAGGVFAYGFLIYAHDENCEGTIPPDVWTVCQWATARGFDYVMLDCDAEPVEGLPVYDYGDPEPQSASPDPEGQSAPDKPGHRALSLAADTRALLRELQAALDELANDSEEAGYPARAEAAADLAMRTREHIRLLRDLEDTAAA